MILIRELIKLFGLGIVSLILIGTAMANDTKIMDLINDIKDVKQEYDSKSFEFNSSFFNPGQIGKLLFIASSLATSLLRIEVILFGFGPIQIIPESITFWANFSFSAKKP